MERTLYIAGPMSGLPEYNYPAFNYAAGELRVAGFEVENPADNTIESEDYHDYLRAGLAQLLRCDGVAVLEDWWLSGGARWEVTTAGILGLPVRSVDEWLRLADAEPVPVKPSLEDVAEVFSVHRWKSMGVVSVECECGAILFGPASLTEFPADEAFRLHLADAVLALLPGRAEAEVKAEALEEEAESFLHLGLPERLRVRGFLLARAARLRGESNV